MFLRFSDPQPTKFKEIVIVITLFMRNKLKQNQKKFNIGIQVFESYSMLTCLVVTENK